MSNCKDFEGQTPLHKSTISGHAGISFNSLNNLKIVFAERYFQGVVKTLLAKGADVNVAEKDGMIPLHVAAFFGHMDIMRALIEKVMIRFLQLFFLMLMTIWHRNQT